MDKLLIIVLISGHLFGNTELSWLIKLPQFIAHYKKHNIINPSANFCQFPVMFYAGDEGSAADDNNDVQLTCPDYHHTGILFALPPLSNMDFCLDQVFYSNKVFYEGRFLAYNPSEHVFSFLQSF